MILSGNVISFQGKHIYYSILYGPRNYYRPDNELKENVMMLSKHNIYNKCCFSSPRVLTYKSQLRRYFLIWGMLFSRLFFIVHTISCLWCWYGVWLLGDWQQNSQFPLLYVHWEVLAVEQIFCQKFFCRNHPRIVAKIRNCLSLCPMLLIILCLNPPVLY